MTAAGSSGHSPSGQARRFPCAPGREDAPGPDSVAEPSRGRRAQGELEEAACKLFRRLRPRLLPAPLSPASRPRNHLKRCQFDSRAPLGWVLLFLCFNDSSQPSGMSWAINSLALLKTVGWNFSRIILLGIIVYDVTSARLIFLSWTKESQMCAEARHTDIWNSFRAKEWELKSVRPRLQAARNC